MTKAIQVEAVSKEFRLYHERYTTLKDRIVRIGRQRYEQFWALRDVTLEVGQGETLGLIGANGSGKTTLLKIIAGILRPAAGAVRTNGRVAALLELGAGFHPDLTGRENVYLNASILGLSRKETDRFFDAIVSFAELETFIDNQVKHYSSGMYVRLGFAVAIFVHPEILLVDEVLAVGDEAFQRKCLDKVRQFQREGRTIVFVTHAVDQVREICTRAACLHQGELVSVGQPVDVIQAFRERLHGSAQIESMPFQEAGTGEVRIISVMLRDSEGRRRQIFHAGEDMEWIVDIDAERRVTSPVVGFTVFDEHDHEVFGTSTRRRQLDLGEVAGKIRVRFTLSDVPFMDGTYRVSVRVTDETERAVYHAQERAYPFRCVNSTADSGHVRVSCDVAVDEL